MDTIISFETEAAITEQLLKSFPHIKSIDDLAATSSWTTVLGNKLKALRPGRFLFGFNKAFHIFWLRLEEVTG